MLIGEFDVLADGGDEDACPLAGDFFGEQAAHEPAVLVVEVADGFIKQDKVERLAKRTDECHPLLLPKGELACRGVEPVVDTQGFEQGQYFFLLFESSKVVLQLHILQSSKLGEEAQVLKEHAQRVLPKLYPLLHPERLDIGFVKVDDALVVVTVAIEVAAKRRFAGARCCLDEVRLALAEGDVGVPHVRRHRITVGKHLGKCLP